MASFAHTARLVVGFLLTISVTRSLRRCRFAAQHTADAFSLPRRCKPPPLTGSHYRRALVLRWNTPHRATILLVHTSDATHYRARTAPRRRCLLFYLQGLVCTVSRTPDLVQF